VSCRYSLSEAVRVVEQFIIIKELVCHVPNFFHEFRVLDLVDLGLVMALLLRNLT
jgi:hypothetical protein